MSEEILEIINSNGEVIGTAPRSEVHGNPALIHKVVHVLVFSPDGDILLQKRSMDKDVAPGLWDTSVGGHMEPGEALRDAARREMKEELGIKNVELEFLYTYTHRTSYETELVHTFSTIYLDDIENFSKEEIIEVRHWSIEDIQKALDGDMLSGNFKHEFQVYLKHIQT